MPIWVPGFPHSGGLALVAVVPPLSDDWERTGEPIGDN